MVNAPLGEIIDEARARGLRYAINDLRSNASHIRGIMEADGVRWDSLQSWAYMEVVCDALEALEVVEPANVSRETFEPAIASSIEVNWETQKLKIEGRPFPWLLAESGPRIEALANGEPFGLVWLPVLAETVTVIGDPPLNVSRETFRAQAAFAAAVEYKMLQLGQRIEVWALAEPIEEGPVAYGDFVNWESPSPDQVLVILDRAGERLVFDAAANVFVPAKARA